MAATGWKGAPVMAFFKGVGGSSVRVPFRCALAHGRVRYVGEPVALIVAETEYIAQDAAGRIAEMTVPWRPLPEAIAVRDRLARAAETPTSAATG